MKCPKCDAKVKENSDRCNQCGQDLLMIQHLCRISNAYYNLALEKAQVRDLSGAAATLRKSLEFNKHNTESRNLLGLVLNEMGETVAALSEWVISKYLQPEENEADRFIGKVQKNPTGLEVINQTIRKYNAALTSTKNGNSDLAIIQLKKAVSLNPKFVRAQQLLALLYIKNREYPKAYKILKQAREIDYSNTTTLRYMMEVGEYKESSMKNRKEMATIERPTKNSLVNVTPVGTYREEKHSWLPFLNVMIGILIGVVISLFLLRPTILNRLDDSASNTASIRSELALKETELMKAQEEITDLNNEIDTLKKQVTDGDNEQKKKMKAYEQLLKGVSLYQENKKTEAAACVSEYKASDFKLKAAKTLFNLISTLSTEDVAPLYESGKEKYDTGKYDEAIQDFEAVLAIDEANQDALYFMGRAYHKKNKISKAKEYYGKVLKVDASTSRASEAKSKLRELGVSEADINSYASTPSPSP